MLDLSELERDAITEMVNIGVGRAAASLAEIVGEEVLLSVPSLSFLTRGEAANFIQRNAISKVAAVKERFDGGFWGDALLIFPCEKSLELVRAMLGEEVPEGDLSELEREALLEVGNIILNACLGSFANLLNGEITCSLPEYLQGESAEVLDALEKADDAVLLLHIDFNMARHEIEGYVVFLIDINSAHAFQGKIQEFLTGIA